MVRKLATEDTVGREALLDFVRARHQWVMVTLRSDGRPQTSPVTGGVSPAGKLVVATYPERDKVVNLGRDPRVTACVLSDHFGGAWVQVDGRATITYAPEAVDDMVEYYRAISGEHPDWDEYRDSMVRQGKCLITIEVERWGPIATGGFPASLGSIATLSDRLASGEARPADAGRGEAQAFSHDDDDDDDGYDDGDDGYGDDDAYRSDDDE